MKKKSIIYMAIILMSLSLIISVSAKESRDSRDLDSFHGNQGQIYDLKEFVDEIYDKKGEIREKSIILNRARDAESFFKNYMDEDIDLRIIAKDKSEKNNIDYTYYQQTYQGIPVYDGYVSVVMKNGRIVKIGYNLYYIEGSFSQDMAEEEAIDSVLKNLEEDDSVESRRALERINNYDRRGLVASKLFIKEDSLVWRILVPNFVYFVDAETGYIERESTIRYDDFYGTVTGAYFQHDPNQGQQYSVFEDGYVFLNNDGTNTSTNETGFFNLSSASPSRLYSYLWGPYVDIYNLVQNYSRRNLSVNSGENSWNWTDNDSSDRQEESNVFYHVNLAHDYFKSLDNLSIDYSIPAYVQYDDCNAYYSGSEGIGELDFGNGGGVSNCTNLALGSDIIYHEYAHMVSDGIYGTTSFPYAMQTGAMSEAWSDYYACTINDDPAQGDRILPLGSVRYLNNSLVYPDDWNWEVHDDSRMLSAALWHVREALGNETADSIILDAMKMKPMSFTDVLNDLLVADDDNANLNDGTPNSSSICNAFMSHGIISDYCYSYDSVEHSEYVNDTVMQVPDLSSVTSEITIQDSESVYIQDIEAYVNISHGRVSNLEIRLISPNGTSILLYGGTGCGWSSGTSLTKWFDQEYPSDGHDCYSPAEMEYFNGMRNNGTWTLNVTDKVSGNSGQLNKFELKFYNNISINISRGNPIEDYNDTDGSIVFDFKCFSYNNISIIQLWTNTTGTWHANYTNSSAQGYTNNTWLNVSVSGIPDGNNYKWGVYCNDTFGNSERSNNRTFSVDVTSPPSIILNSPSQYSNSTSIGFNCSATDIGGLANISLWINTTNGWGLNETSNVSGNSNSSRFDKNLSSNSTYFWTCRACDEQGNCDISANQSLVIDENAPELSLIEPENEKVFGAGTESIVFNWTTHDDYNSSIDCTIYTKAAYQDTKSCENATTCEQTISGFTSGAYTWKINCSDGANQKISSERSFSILQAQRDGGGGGGGALPPTLNGTPENETNETREIVGSQHIVKKLGNIVNPAGTSGMPISGLGVGDEIDFKILNQEHSIKIREITDSVIIEIRSEPIVMKLLVGESRELDLNQDGINDFKISLNKIFNGRATLILFSLPSEQVGEPVEKEPSSSLSWAVYLAIGMILIVIFILITFMKGKKKKSRKK